MFTENNETLSKSKTSQRKCQGITPEFRFVILKGSSCCGCGCHDITVKRQVEFNSPLQNGDYIGSDILDSDEFVDN